MNDCKQIYKLQRKRIANFKKAKHRCVGTHFCHSPFLLLSYYSTLLSFFFINIYILALVLELQYIVHQIQVFFRHPHIYISVCIETNKLFLQLVQEAEGWDERLNELAEQIKMCEESQKDMQEDCSNKDEQIKVRSYFCTIPSLYISRI